MDDGAEPGTAGKDRIGALLGAAAAWRSVPAPEDSRTAEID